MGKGKCEICGKEDEIGKFYWGFFKWEYEPEKWLLVCPNCKREFQKASSVYNHNRTPLIEFENKCKKARQRRR